MTGLGERRPKLSTVYLMPVGSTKTALDRCSVTVGLQGHRSDDIVLFDKLSKALHRVGFVTGSIIKNLRT
jgi:hypothetical protein